MVRLVARLGDFLARKGDDEPGVKTIWLNMQRILDFAAGIKFSRELNLLDEMARETEKLFRTVSVRTKKRTRHLR